MYVDRQWCDKKAADFKDGDVCRVKTSYKWGVGPNEQGRLGLTCSFGQSNDSC